ncbi:hypothetical protein KAZ92_01125 [Candidatus Gracilibacteria bacterium]|nr:hypothetical protein [Candidatus Gracilibacteria bacterium]
MNNNIGSKIRSGLEGAGQKIAKLALRSAVVLGAISGSVQDVQADTVKGVAMATGSMSDKIGIRAERIDLDWDPKNPGAAKLSSQDIVTRTLDQSEGVKVGYDHMTSGNNVITHQPAQGYGKNSAPGIHINYIDSVTTKAKTTSDKQFDGTSIKDATTDGSGAKFGVYDENDRFQLSEGAVPSEDQIIGISEHDKEPTYLIRTYQPVRDDKGHIVDLKLVAITDMNNDADFKTTNHHRVFKDVLVSTSSDGIVVVSSKNMSGVWGKINVKSMGKNSVSGWAKNELHPVFAGKNGEANAKLQSFDTLVVDEKLTTVETVPDSHVTTFDNGNYLFSYDATGCAKVKSKTGEVVSLAKDLDIDTDMGFVQIADNPKTFFGIGINTFTILRITSESPLKIEEFTMPHTVATAKISGAYAAGHPSLFPMKDTNKDDISDFMQNAEAAVVQPGTDAGSDTGSTPDAGSTDTGNTPDAGSTDTEASPDNGSGAETVEKDAGSTDTGNTPDTGSDTGNGTDANGADAGGTAIDSAQPGTDGSKPQGGQDTNNINGPEISSQPPEKPGVNKPPEGCSTSPVSTNGVRDTAPLIVGAALLAAIRARRKELTGKDEEV